MQQMKDLKIPKDPEARIVAIFTHLSYIIEKLEKIEEGKAPMWAATAWKAVFYGVGSAVLAAILALIIIKPTVAYAFLDKVF